MRNTNRANRKQQSEIERPRDLLQIEKVLLTKVRETHSVTTNGKTEERELQEILLQKYMQTALSGSPHALNQMMRFIRETEERHAEKLEYDLEVGVALKEQAEIRIAEAIEAGENPNYVYPHPDDIVINHSEGWCILGVWNEEMLKSIKELEKFCSVLLWQHFLEERLDWPKVEPCEVFPNGTPYKGSAFLFLDLIQQGMPKRFHLGFDDYCLEERKSRGMSKRELLKYVYRRWQQIGCHFPKGHKTLPLKDAYAQFERVMYAVY